MTKKKKSKATADAKQHGGDDAKKKKKKEEQQQQSSAKNNSFQNFSNPRRLSPGVLQYVASQHFTTMTPVQAATIPHFLSHKDVAVQAVTGSGKTLAFLIPVVELLLAHHGKSKFKPSQLGALVLSPTRELAQQTYTVAVGLCASCNEPEPLLLVGGGSLNSKSKTNNRPVTADLKAFQKTGSNLVIGTPGRVQDVLTRYSVIDCTQLECLVLDEADVLLNMGFATTLQDILSVLPKMRRTALFSATQSSSTTTSLSDWMHRVGMRNPVWIDVAVAATNNNSNNNNETSEDQPQQQQATPSSLTNYYLVTKLDEKLSRLAAFLQDHKHEKIIVFFLTCACVDFYGTVFQKLFSSDTGVHIELLHGKMVQKRREKTMERFRGNSSSTSGGAALFCTDVAARGLDVSNVQYTVQLDAPQDPAFYVHRVGRSARAGQTGQSLLFLTPKEEAYVDLLRLRKVPLSPLPASERCCPPDNDNDDPTVADADAGEKGKKKKKADTAGNVEQSNRVILSACHSSDTGENLTIPDVLPRIRDLVLQDRDILEKGTKAFTSYVRAYKEHHCAFIFRFASLDLGLLATSFCLLRLPKMPELRQILQKKGKLPHFTPAGPEIDIFAIPYRDKAREQARQKRLKEELAAGGKNAKLIKAERRKAEKEQKDKERRQQAKDKGRDPDKKRGRQQQIVDEWDDLAKEERLVKKLRRGKITQEEFDTQMYGL